MVEWPFTAGFAVIDDAVFDVDLFADPALTTDISSMVKGFTVKRGRDGNLASFQAGEAVIVLNDPNGDFNPLNESSPYAPVIPGRAIHIKATFAGDEYFLFSGFVRSIEHNPDALAKETRLLCQDVFLLLDRINPEIVTMTSTNTGAAVGAVLDTLNLNDVRSLDQGDAIATFGPFTGDTSALSIIQGLLTAERGEFFQKADGTITFNSRFARYQSGSADTLNDTAIAFTPATDLTNVKNRVLVGNGSFSPQEATDATSISQYGQADYGEITSPYIADADQALGIAEWILLSVKDPTPPVRELEFMANKTNALMTTALSREISDRITVNETTAGAGQFFIEGIEHTVNAGGFHNVKLTLTKVQESEPVIFDSSAFNDQDVIVYGSY